MVRAAGQWRHLQFEVQAHLDTMQLRALRQMPEAYVSRTRGGSTDTCTSLHQHTIPGV